MSGRHGRHGRPGSPTTTVSVRSLSPRRRDRMNLIIVLVMMLLVIPSFVVLNAASRQYSSSNSVNSELIEARQRARAQLRNQYSDPFQKPAANYEGAAVDQEQADTPVEDIYSSYNYEQPVPKTIPRLPDPRIAKPENRTTLTNTDTRTSTGSGVVVLCISARAHLTLRQAIRETWGNDHSVYFIIGGPRIDDDPSLAAQLLDEQKSHGDLLDTGHPDSYYSLVHKLKYGYEWTVENHSPPAQWFLKIDDDSVARIGTLEQTLLNIYNPAVPLVIGEIVVDSTVHKTGKWAEPKYPHDIYPYWAKGSTGHVVSRPVAEYIAKLQHPVYYQGEDTSLGIWLDEATKQGKLAPQWIKSPYFVNHGRCDEHEWLVIGHYLTADQMRECFQKAGDEWNSDRLDHRHHNLYYANTRAQQLKTEVNSRFGVW